MSIQKETPPALGFGGAVVRSEQPDSTLHTTDLATGKTASPEWRDIADREARAMLGPWHVEHVCYAYRIMAGDVLVGELNPYAQMVAFLGTFIIEARRVLPILLDGNKPDPEPFHPFCIGYPYFEEFGVKSSSLLVPNVALVRGAWKESFGDFFGTFKRDADREFVAHARDDYETLVGRS